MYSAHRLDTPPPASRFRRPWSPEPFDPNPTYSNDDTLQRSMRDVQHWSQQQEPSDPSVEALDLADYAHTLQRGDPRSVAFEAFDSYPPSPVSLRPFSANDTPEHFYLKSPTSHSLSGASSHPSHRLFSAPPALIRQPLQSNHSYSGRTTTSRGRDPLQTPTDEEPEIDIGHFPAFTRGWYHKPDVIQDTLARKNASQYANLFDPTYHSREQDLYPSFSPPPLYSLPEFGSRSSHASRNAGVTPWGSDPADTGPVDPEVKEERIRMLQREFGGKGKKGETDNDEERKVGSVDTRGRLITEGPKKRAAVRWLEALLALLAAGSSIYAAAVIKTPLPPPPSGKPPAYALYVLSVITFLLSTYMFIIHPCCAPRHHKKSDTPFTEGPNGMMVLPVSSMPNNKGKGKKGKQDGKEGVQVNLIVDPGMFGGRRDEPEDEEDGSDSEYAIPGTYSRQERRRRRHPKRRSIFAGLAMEAQWKHARKWLKWGMAVDVLLLMLWGAEFIFILIGQRCPSGKFEGWCDAYNVATAAACILCFLFGFSVFFDIKDLHASGSSPRTRT